LLKIDNVKKKVFYFWVDRKKKYILSKENGFPQKTDSKILLGFLKNPIPFSILTISVIQ